MALLLLLVGALAALCVAGYLAACASAQRWLPFIDWLLLRNRSNRKDKP